MKLFKLPENMGNKIRKHLYDRRKEFLEMELKLFTSELRKSFTKEEIKQIARQTKFVQRKSKLDAWQMLRLCAFEEANVAKDTLVKLSTKVSKNNNQVISKQGLDQRFNRNCVKFLKTMFQQLLKNKISGQTTIYPNLKFNKIRILDSTSFQLTDDYVKKYPGSGGSANISGIKIQLEYELKSGEIINMQSGAGSNSDNTFGNKISNTIEKDDLTLKDLGYFNIEVFKEIEKKEAFYISRLKSNIAIYIKNPYPEYCKNGSIKKSTMFIRMDLKEIMDNMQYGEMKELNEVYIGRDEQYKTRLIIYKLTEEQLIKRQTKTLKDTKKKGKSKSENTFSLLGISTYITNISSELYDLEKIYELYSLRWQVELIFKVWKSVYHLNAFKKVKLERFECQLYGKLILILISSTMIFKFRKIVAIDKNKEISEIQLSQVINEYIKEFYVSTVKTFEKTLDIILLIYELAYKNTLKPRKKGKKTPFDIIEVVLDSQIQEKEIGTIA